MPKRMRDVDRSFTVMDDEFGWHVGQQERRGNNRFMGQEPSDAGKKAGRALLRAVAGHDSVVFVMRETTRNSDDNHYFYRVTRVARPDPKVRIFKQADGASVVMRSEFEYEIKAVQRRELENRKRRHRQQEERGL